MTGFHPLSQLHELTRYGLDIRYRVLEGKAAEFMVCAGDAEADRWMAVGTTDDPVTALDDRWDTEPMAYASLKVATLLGVRWRDVERAPRFVQAAQFEACATVPARHLRGDLGQVENLRDCIVTHDPRAVAELLWALTQVVGCPN